MGVGTFRFYRKTDDVEEEFNELLAEARAEHLNPKEEFPISKLFSRELRRPIFVMCGLQVPQMLLVFFFFFFFFSVAPFKDEMYLAKHLG